MECFDVKSKLGFYFDQELQAEEMEGVAAHIRQCVQCQMELHQLQEIETVVRDGLYEEPTPDYWLETPQTIRHKLELIADEKHGHESVLTKFAAFIEQIFMTPSLRWGLLGGLSIMVLLYVGFNLFESVPQETQIAQQSDPKTTQGTTSSQSQESPPVVSSEVAQPVATEKHEPQPDVTADETEPAKVATVQPVIQTRDLALTQVPLKPVRTEGEIQVSVPDHELRPIPASQKVISDLVAREQNVPIPDVTTLSLEQRVDSKHLDITGSTDGLSELESDYLETAKFVEESTTLEEKRNIWLSYVSRQDNFTYKTLGIYHLALVLYDIADLEYDPVKTREAIEFYTKEEKTLRFQMGDEEYEARLSALELMLVQ